MSKWVTRESQVHFNRPNEFEYEREPRNSTYAFWPTTDIPTDIYISREISIEHPSVGLTSFTQWIVIVNFINGNDFIKMIQYYKV